MSDTFPRREVIVGLLVVLCCTGLNDALYTFFGAEGAASVLLLILALLALRRPAEWRIGATMASYLAMICCYLFLGWLWFDEDHAMETSAKYLIMYSTSALLVFAIYNSALSDATGALESTRRLLNIARDSLVITTWTAFITPLINSLAAVVSIDASRRFGGYFGNPNDLAIGGLLAIALTIWSPYRSKLVKYGAIVTCSMAVVLTLSKGAMVVAAILLAWCLVLDFGRTTKSRVYALSITVVGYLLADPDRIAATIEGLIPADFDNFQGERIMAVLEIVSGRIDETTTTNRTVMWDLLLESVWTYFPLPLGLGAGHHIVGGIAEGEVWQGAHNTFLMIFAEGSFISLALLMLVVGMLLTKFLRHPSRGWEFPILLVILYGLMSSHNALSLKSLCVVLALMLARADSLRLGAAPRILAEREHESARTEFDLKRESDRALQQDPNRGE